MLAEPEELQSAIEEARRRSQAEKNAIFWVAALDEAIDRETVEFYRSKEILSRKERGAQTKDETALVSEEKRRQRRHQEELRRLLRQALLAGSVFFRGNDRSPDPSVTDVGRAAEPGSRGVPSGRLRSLRRGCGSRNEEGPRRPHDEREPPGTHPRLQRSAARAVGERPGRPRHRQAAPSPRSLARIENRFSYGEIASGRSLSDHFAGEPYGWEFDTVRLFVLALLRAGKIQMTSGGQPIESAVSIEARNVFGNNNLFRQATFQPKKGLDFQQVVEASESFKDTFGQSVAELEQGAVAREIREQVERCEDAVQTSALAPRLKRTPRRRCSR